MNSNPAAMALPAREHHSRLPDLTLILITMIWGATFLAVQTGLRWAGPYGFVAMRFGAASLVALLWSRKHLASITRAEWRAGMLVGFILFFSYTLQTIGLASIASSKSAFLTALYVPLVPLFQWGLFRQRPHLAAWAGIGLAFIGLLLLADPRGMSFNFGIGEWLTVVGAGTIAMEICVVGRFAARCEPRRVAVVQLLTVAVMSSVAMLLHGEALPQPTPGLLAIVLCLGLSTALIQVAMNWAQKTVPATRATVIYAMEPVWGGLVGWLVGERLGLMGVSGAALIVFSVLASSLGASIWRPRRKASVAA